MIVQICTPQLELWRIEGEFVNVPHIHEHQLQITVPIRGTCFLTQENKPYELANGKALVQHPNENHYFHIGAEAGVLIFKIAHDKMKEFVRRESIEFALQQQFDPLFLGDKFRKWTSTLLSCDPVDRLAQEEWSQMVLYFLFGALSGDHKDGALFGQSDGPGFPDPFIGRVIEYIHDQYSSAIDIDSLAAIALQSRSHFIRSFKSATGVTPYQYVLRLRMDEAKKRIRLSGMSVTEISFSLGFSSASQFYRAFVKAAGMTPEQYRSSKG